MRFLFAFLIAVPLCGRAQTPAAGRPLVVGTTTILADMAQAIAGPHARVVSFMPTGGDPHTYDPVPADAPLLARADLILRNGLKLEGWLDKLIANSGTQAQVVTAARGITPITGAGEHAAPDPHIWGNPLHGIGMAANIRRGLARLLPEHADAFQANFERYAARLRQLDRYIAGQIERVPAEKRVLITAHDAFSYYGRRYGLRVESLAGISTDSDIQAGDMQDVISVIDETGVPALFVESTINPKTIQQISQDRGIVVGGELFSDSLGPEGSRAGTYTGMLRHNTDTIVGALLEASQAAGRELDYLLFGLSAGGLFLLAFGWVSLRLQKRSAGQLPADFELRVEQLTASYEDQLVLPQVSLRFRSGRLHGVLGGNGSGKTTLFKAILGLVQPDGGRITLGGQPLGGFRGRIAYVPQREEIDWQFPATVADVVRMGRYPHRRVFQRLRPLDEDRVDAALHRLGIADLRGRQIGELSGGQQQRVFLARALAQDADCLFLDEPFAGIDTTTEQTIIGLLRELAAAGKLVLVIHHDLSKVRQYFDEVVLLNRGVIAQGATETVFTDEKLRATYAATPAEPVAPSLSTPPA